MYKFLKERFFLFLIPFYCLPFWSCQKLAQKTLEICLCNTHRRQKWFGFLKFENSSKIGQTIVYRLKHTEKVGERIYRRNELFFFAAKYVSLQQNRTFSSCFANSIKTLVIIPNYLWFHLILFLKLYPFFFLPFDSNYFHSNLDSNPSNKEKKSFFCSRNWFNL